MLLGIVVTLLLTSAQFSVDLWNTNHTATTISKGIYQDAFLSVCDKAFKRPD